MLAAWAKWGKKMRDSHDSDRGFGNALWGHGCIVIAVCILAALVSFPTGW